MQRIQNHVAWTAALSETKKTPSADVLEVLRRHYLSFADAHRSYVVALHHP
jgi:hypothetical protein